MGRAEAFSQGPLWNAGRAFRRQQMDVLEWTTAQASLDVKSLYDGLQEYGLRLALSLSPSFGVAMETIRLIEMDDRSLEVLSKADLLECVDRSLLLRNLDAFSQTQECLTARCLLFDLD